MNNFKIWRIAFANSCWTLALKPSDAVWSGLCRSHLFVVCIIWAELSKRSSRSASLYLLHQLFLSLAWSAVEKFLADVLEHKERIILNLSGGLADRHKTSRLALWVGSTINTSHFSCYFRSWSARSSVQVYPFSHGACFWFLVSLRKIILK